MTASIIPGAYAWPSLLVKDGDDLFDHYRHALDELGKHKGTLGLIFGKAQNKFQDPVKLRRLVVDLIDICRITMVDRAAHLRKPLQAMATTRSSKRPKQDLLPFRQNGGRRAGAGRRSEEHTSELQSPC